MIYPGQGAGLATLVRNQEGETPMDREQQEAPDTDSSEVDHRRGPRVIPEDQVEAYLERRLQDALARQNSNWTTSKTSFM